MANYYEILGVRIQSDAEEVRAAYRKLAREYHPDVNPDPRAHEYMAQINVAFEILGDPARRMEYDASLGNVETIDRETKQKEGSRPSAVQVRIHRRLRAHKTPVYAIGFVPETDMLVTSAFDNEVFWWNEKFDYPDRRERFEGGAVNAMAVVNSSRITLAGSTDQQLSCWSYHDGRIKNWRQNPKNWVCTVALSPDGENLAVGDVGNLMKVVRVGDGITRFVGDSHTDAITALAWNRDSTWLASGSVDTSVRIWSAKTGVEIHHIDRIVSTVTAMAFSPDNKWLAIASVDLSLRIIRLADLALTKSFYGHVRPIESLAFHPASGLLASGSRDGTIGLWNVRQGIGHGRIEASHQPISAVAFSGHGNHLVSGGIDKVLRVWSLSAASEGDGE